MLVCHYWILSLCGLYEWFGEVAPAVLERDSDQLEIVITVSVVEALPAWQLFTASSPGAPHVEQHAFAAQVAQVKLSAIEFRQSDVG
jgi:hypothetical protein